MINWITPSSILGTVYNYQSYNFLLSATSSTNNNITYSLASGSLPDGAALLSNGYIYGTALNSPPFNNSTVINDSTGNPSIISIPFVIRANDGATTSDNYYTINRILKEDEVTWLSPASNLTQSILISTNINIPLSAASKRTAPITYSSSTLPDGVEIQGNKITGAAISGNKLINGISSLITASTFTQNVKSNIFVNWLLRPYTVLTTPFPYRLSLSNSAVVTIYHGLSNVEVPVTVLGFSNLSSNVRVTSNTLPDGMYIKANNIIAGKFNGTTANLISGNISLVTVNVDNNNTNLYVNWRILEPPTTSRYTLVPNTRVLRNNFTVNYSLYTRNVPDNTVVAYRADIWDVRGNNIIPVFNKRTSNIHEGTVTITNNRANIQVTLVNITAADPRYMVVLNLRRRNNFSALSVAVDNSVFTSNV